MKWHLLTVILFANYVNAAPLINHKYIYYDVSPTSRHQLLNELNATTPIKEDGEVFHAYTDSHITWKFWWDPSENYCQITKVNVTVDVTFTLPKLNKAPKTVSVVWNKWYPNLVKHENGHKNNALKIANKIEKGIYQLPRYKSCKELESKANALGQALITKLKRMNKAYDRRTNHGESEGASLHLYL